MMSGWRHRIVVSGLEAISPPAGSNLVAITHDPFYSPLGDSRRLAAPVEAVVGVTIAHPLVVMLNVLAA